jgi:hypothetical protein
MVPALIRYTDDMPQWMGGYAKWFYIAIRPKYKDDKGIHAHELEHVKQWWIVTLLTAAIICGLVWYTQAPIAYYQYAGISVAMLDLLYSSVDRFKLQCEVWAYKAQLRVNAEQGVKDYTKLYAGWIATKYGLSGVTAERAERLLRA